MPDNTTRLGFSVPSLNVVIQNLKNKGYKIIAEPTMTKRGYTASIQDLDGRKIELLETK